MRCYHCAVVDRSTFTFQVAAAVAVCMQCGEAVCGKHAVKSDVPLPHDARAGSIRARRALLPILCPDCDEAIRAMPAAEA